MKSLIKKIAKFKLVTKLRDGFGIRPLIFNTNNLNENVSISDAFIWRTDNSYKTIFKYSDLLKIFFKQGTQEVEIIFYDYQNLLVNDIQATLGLFGSTITLMSESLLMLFYLTL